MISRLYVGEQVSSGSSKTGFVKLSKMMFDSQVIGQQVAVMGRKLILGRGVGGSGEGSNYVRNSAMPSLNLITS